MQFILTEEELKSLTPKSKYDKMCVNATRLAEMLAEVGKWAPSTGGPGCCKIKESKNWLGYCDGCPAVKYCPKEKHYSK